VHIYPPFHHHCIRHPHCIIRYSFPTAILFIRYYIVFVHTSYLKMYFAGRISSLIYSMLHEHSQILMPSNIYQVLSLSQSQMCKSSETIDTADIFFYQRHGTLLLKIGKSTFEMAPILECRLQSAE
jgi:hypothetical protein